MFEEIIEFFNALEGWRLVAAIVAALVAAIVVLVIALVAGRPVGVLFMIVGVLLAFFGVIALIISFFGFLIFEEIAFSFRKPLFCVGGGILLLLMGGGFFSVADAWEERKRREPPNGRERIFPLKTGG